MVTILAMLWTMPMITVTASTTVTIIQVTDSITELVTVWTTDSVLITASITASITALAAMMLLTGELTDIQFTMPHTLTAIMVPTTTHITVKLHISKVSTLDTMMLHIMKDSTVITTQLLYIIREHSMDIMKRLHSTRIGPTITTMPTHITTTENSKEKTTKHGHITPI